MYNIQFIVGNVEFINLFKGFVILRFKTVKLFLKLMSYYLLLNNNYRNIEYTIIYVMIQEISSCTFNLNHFWCILLSDNNIIL